ncbi:transcription initiation factor IIF subunit beta [Rhodotorula toruloides]|uniref:Transcription initiation factor IIF subunit beta n=1 Tax=Rhodotorula toruloides TaxID=5286 RepID=A0A511KK76_RHOTO|nr:transcription initiation factor IIF subunit beta [Rhodotorula toruloides]
MAFAFRKDALPEEFEAEHGTIDLTDDIKPAAGGAGGDDGEDEDLDLARAKQKVWLCKVPRFLLEKWQQAQSEGEILGRLRLWDEKDASGQAKIAVILQDSHSSSSQPTPGPSSSRDSKPDFKGKRPAQAQASDGVPTEYKVTVQNSESRNLFVFGEKVEEVMESGEEGARKKRRITSLLGTVAHECSLTPSISSADASAAYARILRERQRKASEPKRTLKRLEVDDATANRLASGMGAAGIKGRVATFNNTSSKAKPGSSAAAQRNTKMDRPALLDEIFTRFSSAPYWSFRTLNDHLRQPQTYLREVLGEVAHLVPKGPYANMWALKPEFKGTQGVRSMAAASAGPGGSTSTSSGRTEARAGVKRETEAILGNVSAVKKEEGEDEYGGGDGDSDDDLEMVS